MEVIRLDRVSLLRRTQEEFSYDLKKTALSLMEGKYRRPVRRCVLDQIDLTVMAGEKLGVIGANGSGKSTLLKVICNILEPTHGRVWVRGNIAPLIELGAGFDIEISVAENIILYGVMLGFSEQNMRRRTLEILKFAELEDYEAVPVKALSSGMVARLGFAIATEVQPDILILDEILSVGDERFKNKCKQRIERFWQANSTVLLVSHDLEFVRKSCQRVVWLEHGRVRALGDTQEVIDTYINSVALQDADLDPQPQPTAQPEIEEIPFAEVILPSPTGSHDAAIRRVFITNQLKQVTDTIAFTEPFYIGLDYEIFAPLHSFITGFHLKNAQGVIILEPANLNPLPPTGEIRAVGKHRIYIQIPALLCPGIYHIAGIAVREENFETRQIKTHQQITGKLVSFKVELTESYRNEWFGQELVHPLLEWTLESWSGSLED